MIRNVTLEEITDGKLYKANDMVKADCYDCTGCHDCCTGMGDSIVLDPLDVHRLAVHLKKTPSELMGLQLILGVTDKNILPHMRCVGADERCIFLSNEGRCTVHTARPGFCRLFPLGRYYENGDFSYILQVHECKKTNRGKIKVKKWLDTPDLKRYEKFVCSWHYFLKDVQRVLEESQDPDLIKNLNLFVVNQFYIKAYDPEKDFYEQFEERLAKAKALLALND